MYLCPSLAILNISIIISLFSPSTQYQYSHTTSSQMENVLYYIRVSLSPSVFLSSHSYSVLRQVIWSEHHRPVYKCHYETGSVSSRQSDGVHRERPYRTGSSSTPIRAKQHGFIWHEQQADVPVWIGIRWHPELQQSLQHAE